MVAWTGTPSPGELLRAWAPTALGASMLVVEIPLVYAAVARSTGGSQALAGLGICVSVLVVANTPALALTPLVVVSGGRRLIGYAVVTGVLGSAALLVLVFVPPVAAGFRGLLALSDDAVWRHVREGLAGLAVNPVGVALRRRLHGRLVVGRRTGVIATATTVRIAASAALAVLGVVLVPAHGAFAGGAALSAGALLETVLLGRGARQLSIPDRRGERVAVVLGRHAHLSAARLLAMVPMFVTTVFIAHSHGAAVSLVVWPALYELLMLFSSPTGDWAAVTGTALRDGWWRRAARQATWWLAFAWSAGFTVVVLTGPGALYLRHLVGVPAVPTELGVRWAPVLLAVPALWVIRAYLHGVLLAVGATSWLSWASVVHLAALGGTAAALSATALPGIAVGVLALVAGILADVLVLWPASARVAPVAAS